PSTEENEAAPPSTRDARELHTSRLVGPGQTLAAIARPRRLGGFALPEDGSRRRLLRAGLPRPDIRSRCGECRARPASMPAPWASQAARPKIARPRLSGSGAAEEE